jgi:hypothetical protein
MTKLCTDEVLGGVKKKPGFTIFFLGCSFGFAFQRWFVKLEKALLWHLKITQNGEELRKISQNVWWKASVGWWASLKTYHNCVHENGASIIHMRWEVTQNQSLMLGIIVDKSKVIILLCNAFLQALHLVYIY